MSAKIYFFIDFLQRFEYFRYHKYIETKLLRTKKSKPMKKSFSFFFIIAGLVMVLSSNTNKISTFVMTMVAETPRLPGTPFEYSDIPFPDHIFNEDNTDTIGYRAGGRLDNLVFDFIEDDIATLGRVLFYDKKLSALEDISCGTCHIQELSFTEAKRFSEGISSPTKRNSMHLNDLAWSNADGFSWIMKENELSSMILLPLTDENEIGANIEDVRIKLENTTYYPELFTKAFGTSNISEDRIVDALVHFISSMTTFNSRFDQELKEGFSGFTQSEQLGMDIFAQNCGTCHTQGAHSFFGDEVFIDGSIVQLFPFFFNNGLEEDANDLGAGEWLVGLEHLFKVPSLRNIELTGPYMHDGQFTTLEEVIDHYSEGIVENKWTGFFLPAGGFQFTQDEKTALLDFMNTFTDESFLTNEKWSDPFDYIVPLGEQLTIESISLHPNPTTDRATISFDNAYSELVAISIYTQDGKLIKHVKITSDYYSIDKADYPEGIYFINLLMGSKRATQKLIIQ